MAQLIVSLIIRLIRGLGPILVPAIREAARDTAEDGRAPAALRDRLRRRVREIRPGLALVGILAAALAGCGTRTIYVPSGDPVRLREPIRRAKVWTFDKDGKATPGVMDIPAGWYALPDPGPGPDARLIPEPRQEGTPQPTAPTAWAPAGRGPACTRADSSAGPAPPYSQTLTDCHIRPQEPGLNVEIRQSVRVYFRYPSAPPYCANRPGAGRRLTAPPFSGRRAGPCAYS